MNIYICICQYVCMGVGSVYQRDRLEYGETERKKEKAKVQSSSTYTCKCLHMCLCTCESMPVWSLWFSIPYYLSMCMRATSSVLWNVHLFFCYSSRRLFPKVHQNRDGRSRYHKSKMTIDAYVDYLSVEPQPRPLDSNTTSQANSSSRIHNEGWHACINMSDNATSSTGRATSNLLCNQSLHLACLLPSVGKTRAWHSRQNGRCSQWTGVSSPTLLARTFLWDQLLFSATALFDYLSPSHAFYHSVFSNLGLCPLSIISASNWSRSVE